MRYSREKFAIIGSRGIPNNYGGFEKFIEVLSVGLSESGYRVFVSCEYSENPKNRYKGVSLFYFPLKPPRSGILRMVYEIFYDVYSLLWASRSCDYVYMLGYGAAPFFFIPRLHGKKLLLNPDGLEWKRDKFNTLVKFLMKLNERLGCFWAHVVVADSQQIKQYLDLHYNVNSHFIPYGAKRVFEVTDWDSEMLPERIRDVTPNPSYWLVVARLEPENNIHVVVEAYLKSRVTKPLLLVGNFASPAYEASIMKLVGKNPEKQVIFAGGIYDQRSLNMLRENCFGYIHGHSVGGTNPSLLEIMALKTVILAHKNPYNLEVCGDSAIYFEDALDLKQKIDMVDSNLEEFLKLKEKAYQRVRKNYSWGKVVEDYENLIKQLKVEC